jgi:hypothetical protein
MIVSEKGPELRGPELRGLPDRRLAWLRALDLAHASPSPSLALFADSGIRVWTLWLALERKSASGFS